jgi:hypothetical protein
MSFHYIADRFLKETQSMLLPTLLHRRQRQVRRARRRPSPTRLLLEWLEPRNLLSVMNVNTDSDLSAPHPETSIAVNPTNPLNLIGSAGDYQIVYNSSGQFVSSTGYSRAHVTFDGGQTWTNFTVPFNTNLYTLTGDPGVAFDADGTAYFSTLGSTILANGQRTPEDIQVAHSVNGGQSWSVPVRVAAGSGTATGAEIDNDKPYIAAWGHGNAIVTWTEFIYGSNHSFEASPIFASLTHDGGNTWTAPLQISPQKLGFQANQFSVPVMAADGSLYVAFINLEQPSFENARDQYLVVKVDPVTGKAVRDPVKVADLVDGREDYPVNVDNRTTYQDSEFRTDSDGNITADPTNALHLVVVWSDMRNSTLPAPTDPYQAKTNSDIIMSQSLDGGNTWSAPTALAIPHDQFMPWGAYNARGQLQIGFFDRSYDPANHKYGYTLASETTPGSLNFTEQQVTTALSDPTQGDAAFFAVTVNPNFPHATTFIGDYGNIAISPNGVAAFWTDMRLQANVIPQYAGWSEDAFFALVTAPPPSAAAVLAPSAAAFVVPALPGIPPKGGTTNPATLMLFPQTAPASADTSAAAEHPPAVPGNVANPASANVAPDGTYSHANTLAAALPSAVAHLRADALAQQISDSLFGSVVGDKLWA